MTTLQLIPHLAPIARTVTTVGAVGSEVLTAGAILAALNITGTAIQKTYAAGRFTRRIVDATVIPAADFISWLNAQIDWAEAGAAFWACLTCICTALYVAGEFTGRAVKTAHANWTGDVVYTAPTIAPEPIAIDPRDIYAIEASFAEPTVAEMPDFAEYVDFMAPRDLAALKVVELRKLARGQAKGVHMMRKPELLALLAA